VSASAPVATEATSRPLAVAVRGVVHLYSSLDGDVVALRGVDLDVAPGTSLALLGPSGAGKSTLLGLLAGRFAASAGRVLVGGEDVGRMGAARLARFRALEVSLVVQGAARNLLAHATVADNVWFARRGAVARKARPELSTGELLEVFDLSGLADRVVADLPAGAQQVAALAAGVAPLPGLVLLDEPTGRLDPAGRDRVLDAVESISTRLRTTVVVVTHDPVVAAAMGRTITISDGRVGAEGVDGENFAVVGADGALQLPSEALGLLPPGSLVEVVAVDGRVELRRRSG